MSANLFKNGKTNLPIVLSLVLIIALSSAVNSASFLGDLNEDGVVNIQDVSKLTQHILGIKVLDAEQLKAADVNCDGKLDVQDVNLIMQKVLGLIEVFPASKKTTLDYDRPEEDDLPGEVKIWLENSREDFTAQTYEKNDFLYILVSYGWRPTTGYLVQIIDIFECEKMVIVNAQFSIEEPAGQAYTNPYDLIMLEDRGLPVKFVATGAEKGIPKTE